MPQGKPANTRVQLSDSNLCMIFGFPPLRPKVRSGSSLAPKCAGTRQQAITYLLELEALTAP